MENSKFPAGTKVKMVKRWLPPDYSDIPGIPAEFGEVFVVVSSNDTSVWLTDDPDMKSKSGGFGPVPVDSFKLVDTRS